MITFPSQRYILKFRFPVLYLLPVILMRRLGQSWHVLSNQLRAVFTVKKVRSHFDTNTLRIDTSKRFYTLLL